jgi:hypothetical protein
MQGQQSLAVLPQSWLQLGSTGSLWAAEIAGEGRNASSSTIPIVREDMILCPILLSPIMCILLLEIL